MSYYMLNRFEAILLATVLNDMSVDELQKKSQINIRLNGRHRAILELASKRLGVSKTSIIIYALEAMVTKFTDAEAYFLKHPE